MITNANAVAPMNSLLYHDPFNVNIPLPLGPGYGRGRIAAILEACTGRSLLRPNAPRAVQQDHARKVAEARAALRLDAAPVKPARKPRRQSISKMIEEADKAGKPLASITMPDGTKLDFGKPESAEPENPWSLDEFRTTKETKQ